MLLTKCNWRASASWQSAVWTVIHNCCAKVRTALARIADDSYGVCLHCEEDITPKRLNAVPWTSFCIRCQEAADANQIETVESLEALLQNAA